VGYLNNINSDRQLIAFCSDSLSIRLFLGYDVHEQLPWHSTISRTRGRGEEALLKLNDAEILQRIAEERFRILGAKDGLHDYRIHRWDNALPYYGLDLEKALKELNALPASKEVYLHGNYLSGIGLSKILERTEKLALQIGANNV
jgi:protoporphyrinogen oxidase